MGKIKLRLALYPSTQELRWEELLHEVKGGLGYTVKLYFKTKQNNNNKMELLARWLSG